MKEVKPPNRPKAADIVRERSKAGQLLSTGELLGRLSREQVSISEEKADRASAGALLREAMAEDEDVKEVTTREGRAFYYSSQFMSDPYARMLLQKQEGPPELVANTVREDSERYPRPTPLDLFKEAPFDLSHEELLSCLEGMSDQNEFQDISQLTTSVGHVFLYSSKYLDRDYALMLAEWTDVGQFENP